jgi:hypothetical protein
MLAPGNRDARRHNGEQNQSQRPMQDADRKECGERDCRTATARFLKSGRRTVASISPVAAAATPVSMRYRTGTSP